VSPDDEQPNAILADSSPKSDSSRMLVYVPRNSKCLCWPSPLRGECARRSGSQKIEARFSQFSDAGLSQALSANPDYGLRREIVAELKRRSQKRNSLAKI
jgi:hypothetical protein